MNTSVTTETGADGIDGIGAGGAAAGGGGASALFAEAGASVGDGGAGAGAGAGQGAGGGAGEAPLQYADWMNVFSDKAGDNGEPSPRDWVAKAGFKDMDAVALSAREAQRALRTAIPAEGDPKEKWDAHWQKLGRPEKPEGYEIKAPDGFSTNDEFTGRFRQTLFEAGATSKQAAALVDWYNTETLNGLQAESSAQAAQRQALRTEWGADFNANLAVARRGMEVLGIDNAMLDAWGRGGGIDATIKALHKLGTMTKEDMLHGNGGGGGQGFTMSESDAQAQMDAFNKDPAKGDALRRGDAGVKAEQDRLIGQLAAARDAKKKAG